MSMASAALPPIVVDQKTVKGNFFSKHDNRHAFQNSGCYFGQGLGKRLQKDISKNQHRSENHTTWRSQANYASVYKDSYSENTTEGGRERRRCSSVNCTPPPSSHVCKYSTIRADSELLRKFETVTKSTFRRFPRSHSLPEKLIEVRPSECTPWWYRPISKAPPGQEHSTTVNDKNSSVVESTVKNRVYTTPLSVLAATQQPFLTHNPWTYSYKK